MSKGIYAEIASAVKHVRPFSQNVQGWRVEGENVAVLSWPLRRSPHPLSGPLAEYVTKSLREYHVQYMTGGGRRRMPGHVAYYVTANGYVLGYVAANGEAVISPVTDVPAQVVAAVHGALNEARERQMYYSRREDELHLNPGHVDGEGCTFALYERDTRVSIHDAEVTATFTDRDEAFAAFMAADDLKNRRSAWVKRIEVAA